MSRPELSDLKSRFDGLKNSLADVRRNIETTSSSVSPSSESNLTSLVQDRLDDLETTVRLLSNVILLMERSGEPGYDESMKGMRTLIERAQLLS